MKKPTTHPSPAESAKRAEKAGLTPARHSEVPIFTTRHNLQFETAPWPHSPEFIAFRVGTCEGLYRSTRDTYDILAITNSNPGNGHFEDVLQWFERSCRRDRRYLRVLEIWNENFKQHLIQKRKFIDIGNDIVVKHFTSL